MSDMVAIAPMPRLGFNLWRVAGCIMLGLLAVLAVVGPPALVGADPARQSLLDSLQGPSAAHLLGTDHLGRDMAARLLSGAQLSLSLSRLFRS